MVLGSETSGTYYDTSFEVDDLSDSFNDLAEVYDLAWGKYARAKLSEQLSSDKMKKRLVDLTLLIVGVANTRHGPMDDEDRQGYHKLSLSSGMLAFGEKELKPVLEYSGGPITAEIYQFFRYLSTEGPKLLDALKTPEKSITDQYPAISILLRDFANKFIDTVFSANQGFNDKQRDLLSTFFWDFLQDNPLIKKKILHRYALAIRSAQPVEEISLSDVIDQDMALEVKDFIKAALDDRVRRRNRFLRRAAINFNQQYGEAAHSCLSSDRLEQLPVANLRPIREHLEERANMAFKTALLRGDYSKAHYNDSCLRQVVTVLTQLPTVERMISLMLHIERTHVPDYHQLMMDDEQKTTLALKLNQLVMTVPAELTEAVSPHLITLKQHICGIILAQNEPELRAVLGKIDDSLNTLENEGDTNQVEDLAESMRSIIHELSGAKKKKRRNPLALEDLDDTPSDQAANRSLLTGDGEFR